MPAATINLLAALEGLWERGEPAAVATLVGVRGSAPWLPGARMLATAGGTMVGAVSGGCVESDVFERAQEVLRSGGPALVTYGVADELALEVGTSCGSIDVLIEAVGGAYAGAAETGLREVWEALGWAVRRRHGAVLVTTLAPAPLLARKLLLVDGDSNGKIIGSIDADVDSAIVAAARRVLAAGGSQRVTLPWNGQEAAFFVEAFPPAPRLFVVGATHTASALCRTARGLGFHVGIVDPRTLFATRERFPDADELIHAWPEEALRGAALDASSHVVVLAHDPKFDVPALAIALRSNAAYVGALGSRRTHARRVEKLRQQGFGDAELARIRAPIGLDLGARTPEEIAVSILAEILAFRSARDARPLHCGSGSINAPKPNGGLAAGVDPGESGP